MALFNELSSIEDKLTVEEIEKRVTTQEIWQRYYGNVQLHKRIKVPACLRNSNKEDSNPSGSFLVSSDGNIIFYDHAYHTTFNVYSYLRKLYPNLKFNDILKMINYDMRLGIGSVKATKTMQGPAVIKQLYEPQSNLKYKTNVDINIENYIKDKFSINGFKYWNKFKISEETLNFFDVVELDGYEIEKDVVDESTGEITRKKVKYNKKDSLCFAYVFYNPDTQYTEPVAYKIYMPHEKYKWISNCTKYIVGGAKQIATFADYYEDNNKVSNNGKELIRDYTWFNSHVVQDYPLIKILDEEIKKSKGIADIGSFDRIILTSSMKDVMCWAELGYHSMCQQAEYPEFMNKQFLSEVIQSYYLDIVINYDNDDTGFNNANVLSKSGDYFNRGLLFTEAPQKDISDYMEQTDFKTAIKRYGRITGK